MGVVLGIVAVLVYEPHHHAPPGHTMTPVFVLPGVGGTTTGGTTLDAVTAAVQNHIPDPLFIEMIYAVVALDGGTMIVDPDAPRMIFPGLSMPVELLAIFHERIVPLPLVTVFGLMLIVHDGGGVTGGVTTGIAVTDAVHELFHDGLDTLSVYGVVALDGGTMIVDPEAPSTTLPGLSIPVELLVILHERIAPLPLFTVFGLILIVHDGGGMRTLLVNRAKYEK